MLDQEYREEIASLQEKYDTLLEVIRMDRNTISILENQHLADLKIIENYRIKLRELERIEDNGK